MAVKLRLKRFGRKGNPFYRIVAIDESKRRDGRELEILGHYDPSKKDSLVLKVEDANNWISKGAIPSETVAGLIKRAVKKQTN